MTSNLFYDTAGDILSPQLDEFALVYQNGDVLSARGTRSFLKESPGQISAAFSESGLTVWVSVPPTPQLVEFVRLPSTGACHRVIFHELIGSIERSCRFQLQTEPSTDAAFATIDFDQNDFSRLDFA